MLNELLLRKPTRQSRRLSQIGPGFRQIGGKLAHLRCGHRVYVIEFRFDHDIALHEQHAIASRLAVSSNFFGLHSWLAVERVGAVCSGCIGETRSTDRQLAIAIFGVRGRFNSGEAILLEHGGVAGVSIRGIGAGFYRRRVLLPSGKGFGKELGISRCKGSKQEDRREKSGEKLHAKLSWSGERSDPVY